jgi:hypothetical protein
MSGIFSYIGGTTQTTDVRNNMIRLGIDKNGSSINTAYKIFGIRDSIGKTATFN